MKLEIHKLLDSWQEDNLELREAADSEQIRSKTMEKLQSKKKRRPILRYGLIAATLAILMVGSVFAAYNAIRIEEKAPAETVYPADGEKLERIFFAPNHAITVEATGEGHMVGFRPGTLPEGDMTPIRFSLKGDVSYFYSEADAANIPADILTETNTAVRSEKEGSSWDILYDIQLLNSAQIYRRELNLNGEVTVVKEEKLGDYEGVWLTLNQKSVVTAIIGNEKQYALCQAPVQNILLLYSAEYDCLLRIAGNSELLSFEDLEQIALEMELVGTDLPAKAAEENRGLDGSVG